METENAQLTASLVEATNTIAAAESRSSRSENNLAAVEARVGELDACTSKANSASATKAAESDVLARDLTVAREAVVAAHDRASALQIQVSGLEDACQELSSVREGATAKEDALKVDLANALKRCTAVERERDQCFATFESQWKAREANTKREWKKLEQRAKLLSADVEALTNLLQTQRDTSEALAHKVCSASNSEEPQGGGGRGATRVSRFGTTESLEHGPRASEARLFFDGAAIDSKRGGICLGTEMSSGP